jgi:hypothetical protein
MQPLTILTPEFARMRAVDVTNRELSILGVKDTPRS